MSDTVLELQPLAPLLLRDGRPFAAGGEESRAQSLPLPLPHTLAGFVRTQLGEARGFDWRSLKGLDEHALYKRLRELHGTPIRSLLLRNDTFMFPAPLNAVVDKDGNIYRSAPEPLKAGEGVNLPDDDLRPPLLSPDPGEGFKPAPGYNYWPTETMKRWLLGETPEQREAISGPPSEERTHVSIDPTTGAGVEGELFTVSYRSFEDVQDGTHHRWTMRVKTDVQGEISKLGHLGGERRPVALANLGNDPAAWPNKGQFQEVTNKLLDPNQSRICFILTSPALFTHGWKPAWLTEDTGPETPAGVRVLRGKVKLVGAAVGRRVAVSGWTLRENKPKAVRWAVPAGSVYFLEVTEDFDRKKLLDAWLKPLSDRQNDQRDGFGCALWGVW